MLLYARCCPGTWHPGWPIWVTQSLGTRPVRACLTNLPQTEKTRTLESTSYNRAQSFLSKPKQLHISVLTIIPRCNQWFAVCLSCHCDPSQPGEAVLWGFISSSVLPQLLLTRVLPGTVLVTADTRWCFLHVRITQRVLLLLQSHQQNRKSLKLCLRSGHSEHPKQACPYSL